MLSRSRVQGLLIVNYQGPVVQLLLRRTQTKQWPHVTLMIKGKNPGGGRHVSIFAVFADQIAVNKLYPPFSQFDELDPSGVNYWFRIHKNFRVEAVTPNLQYSATHVVSLVQLDAPRQYQIGILVSRMFDHTDLCTTFSSWRTRWWCIAQSNVRTAECLHTEGAFYFCSLR